MRKQQVLPILPSTPVGAVKNSNYVTVINDVISDVPPREEPLRKAASTPSQKMLLQLREELKRPVVDWPRAILHSVGNEPLATGKSKGTHLIDKETFDWKRLAAELCFLVSDTLYGERVTNWLLSPDPFGSLHKTEFARIMGHEKYRAHLNYHYGVTVERALQLAMEREAWKDFAANARSTKEDDIPDIAFDTLYRSSKPELILEFQRSLDLSANSADGEVSVDTCDSFTYWLFKRRLSLSNPARLASDTNKGLIYLDAMRSAHHKRIRLLGAPERMNGRMN